MIGGCQRVVEFTPLKGRLGLFDVELPYEIVWAEDVFYPEAKKAIRNLPASSTA
jgi:hypothetical protein